MHEKSQNKPITSIPTTDPKSRDPHRRNTPIKITLDQAEITDAVKAYATKMINIAPNQAIDIDFTAGRGDNGISATLNITSAPMTKQPVCRGTSEIIGGAAPDLSALEKVGNISGGTLTSRTIPGIRTPVAVPQNITTAPEAREEPEAEAIDVAEVEAAEINETSAAAAEEVADDLPKAAEPPKARGRSIFSTASA